MPAHTVPLAHLSPVYHRNRRQVLEDHAALRRVIVWAAGILLAAIIYFGVPAFWSWKHVISSSGGRYFAQRIVIPIPVFTQDDPRWRFILLGPTSETMGQAGCAVTSASMVLAGYGVDIDPQRLNQYLITHNGYTEDGSIYWEKAAETAPGGQVEKAYEDLPSYALIDKNLESGNPVIVRLTLKGGHTHFVVIVGKDGWDYLVQDPARSPTWGVYPLRDLTDRIEALRYYRVVPPSIQVVADPAPVVPAPPPLSLTSGPLPPPIIAPQASAPAPASDTPALPPVTSNPAPSTTEPATR